MFVGMSSHQLDEKGRIRIPTKFKDGLGKSPFIMQGEEKCLYVYPYNDAEQMLKKVFGDGNFVDSKKNAAKAVLMSVACRGDEDKQGRVTIPAELINYAGLKKNIVTVAAFDHVQIWDEETWKEFSANKNPGKMFNDIKGSE